MNILTLFLIVTFFHILDDYVLQGILASLKQKKWWKDQVKDLEFTKYKYDYIMALAMHGLSWSIMIHIPIMFFMGLTGWVLPISIILNAAIHSFIDDQKANRFKINLIEDQLLHLLQILIVTILFTVT